MNIPEFPVNPILLIDGDILAFRPAAVAEKTLYAIISFDRAGPPTVDYFDNAKDANKSIEYPTQVRWERKDRKSEDFAIEALVSTIENFSKRFPSSSKLYYLSGERNFRDFIWKTKKYKGNRGVERPFHLEACKKYLTSIGATTSNGWEADDDILIAHYAADPNTTVVCSSDKDLDQAAGWHWDWIKDETYYVDQKSADTFLFEQIVSGDGVDNIPGLDGWGRIKARKVLADCKSRKELLDKTMALFIKEGKSLDYFMEQGSLAFILRKKDQSFVEYIKGIE